MCLRAFACAVFSATSLLPLSSLANSFSCLRSQLQCHLPREGFFDHHLSIHCHSTMDCSFLALTTLTSNVSIVCLHMHPPPLDHEFLEGWDEVCLVHGWLLAQSPVPGAQYMFAGWRKNLKPLSPRDPGTDETVLVSVPTSSLSYYSLPPDERAACPSDHGTCRGTMPLPAPWHPQDPSRARKNGKPQTPGRAGRQQEGYPA